MIRNNINGVKSLSSCLKMLLWILSTLDSDMFNNSMKAEIKKTRHGFSCSVIVKNVRLKIIGMNIFINKEAPKNYGESEPQSSGHGNLNNKLLTKVYTSGYATKLWGMEINLHSHFVFLACHISLGAISIWRVVVPSPKIAINPPSPRTYEKL